jgi:hypothetical protein
MSKKIPPKGVFRRAGPTPSLTSEPAKRAAPYKKTGRYLAASNAISCFDGAGDLNPTKTKLDQPKKR